MLTLDPLSLSIPERYSLLVSSVVPRPIALVSTCNSNGELNLAPFSYFNVVCTEPPTILFCPNVKGDEGTKKDTLLNIEETGEFVVNLVNEAITPQMNQTAGDYPRGINEFEKSGLTPLASAMVKPPRVKESPIHFECKTQQIIQVGNGQRGSGFVVLGTIVRFHFDEAVYQDGHILIEQFKPVARLGSDAYCPVREVFKLPRPNV
ncbi:MAG: flavin reductase family protein [Vampirovibrionales bacterium]|nr:flavin reductase family protein [Vampirovibrionales bacterium]